MTMYGVLFIPEQGHPHAQGLIDKDIKGVFRQFPTLDFKPKGKEHKGIQIP